jgi:agmatine deiminase
MQPTAFSPDTPAALGYRMPAEWHPHAATWLSWPRRDGISFPGRYDEVLPAFAAIARALATQERLNINVADAGAEEEARRALGAHAAALDNVKFQHLPTNEPWCRDYGPCFVRRNGDLAVVDWGYNAWGGKYPPFDFDDAVPQRLAELLRLPLFQPGIVLEGGSIDVNGQGAVLTTEACLLNPNRNPHLSRGQLEQYLRDYLGVTRVLWLGEGIVGDDTDGHVDDIARFVNPTTVVAAVEEDAEDENFSILSDNLLRLQSMTDQHGRPLRVVKLPMPSPVEHDGQRLPASYANFYIANSVVLLPTFRDRKTDARAAQVLQELFPERRIAPIDCLDLIWGLGAVHCLTQQQPAP